MIATVRQLVRATGKLPLGILAVTQGVQHLVKAAEVAKMVERHIQGDWGEVSEDDKALNDLSVLEGGDVLSAYLDSGQRRVWVKTDGWYGPDKGTEYLVTTVLLPDEY